ncbi:hypothetical protein CYMTET_41650 [Cymbomonas tetramitiformis]|uniref:Uncharacterized protein n=1 Tax=Cymbomonas tetramitiformis TaxID=36881 RepID=A0AAE0C6Q5_9CHLO|nr:hypothetical protein CYMTET_41650 [Cymbomonas tetramitiformis]
MSKGFATDQHFSRQDSGNEGLWLEFKGEITPSCRHPCLVLLLTETRDLSEIKEDPLFSEQANQLLYNFLSRVTTKTASAVVGGYSPDSDGCASWQQLFKLRRNTSGVYFTRQVKNHFAHASKLSALAPPLHVFLGVKESLHKIREYSAVAKVTPSGKQLCLETVETTFAAMVMATLHPDYVFIKTKFVGERLPNVNRLEEVSFHYDNSIAPNGAAMETGAAIANDRQRQAELKREQLDKKVGCATCHRLGHDVKDCFITKREEFFKRRPQAQDTFMKKVLAYQKHGKLPASEKACAVTEERTLSSTLG